LEENCSDVSGFFSSVGVSPIKCHTVSISTKVTKDKQKVENVVAKLKEKVARSLAMPASDFLSEQSESQSVIEELKRKAASLDENMDLLKM